jgi:hypothetical protein
MGILERLVGDPVTFLALGLIWATIAVWVVMFLMWALMGDTEAWLAFLCCGMAIGLGFLASKPPHPAIMWAVGGFVILSLPLYPSVRKMNLDRQNAQIDFERMEGAYETLRLRPGNTGAQFRIAEVLYMRGFGRVAIPVALHALSSMPQNLFAAEHRTVDGWRRSHAGTNEAQEVRCPLCGEVNTPREVFCVRCNGPYLLAYARGAWAPAGTMRILAGWLAGACLTIGVPAVAASPLAAGSKTALIAAMAAAAVLLLFRALAKVFNR